MDGVELQMGCLAGMGHLVLQLLSRFKEMPFDGAGGEVQCGCDLSGLHAVEVVHHDDLPLLTGQPGQLLIQAAEFIPGEELGLQIAAVYSFCRYADRAPGTLAVVVGQGVAGDGPQVAFGIGGLAVQERIKGPQQDFLRQILRVLCCGAAAKAVAVDRLHPLVQEAGSLLFVHRITSGSLV